MARGSTSANTRSQRAGARSSRASQSQSQTQTQKRSRAQRVDSDEDGDDGDDDGDADADADMDVDGAEGGGGAADVNLQANRLVRIALFMEHRRMPLKRDDISKKGVFCPSFSIPKDLFDVFQSSVLLLLARPAPSTVFSSVRRTFLVAPLVSSLSSYSLELLWTRPLLLQIHPLSTTRTRTMMTHPLRHRGRGRARKRQLGRRKVSRFFKTVI